MNIISPNLPLTSCICLVFLTLLPAISRQTHAFQRAVQIYDSQSYTIPANEKDEKGTEEETKQKNGLRPLQEGDDLHLLLVAFIMLIAVIFLSIFQRAAAKDLSANQKRIQTILPYIAYLSFVPKVISDALFDFIHRDSMTVGRRQMLKDDDDTLITLAPRQIEYIYSNDQRLGLHWEKGSFSLVLTILSAILLYYTDSAKVIIIPTVILSAYIIIWRTNQYPQMLGGKRVYFMIHVMVVIGSMIITTFLYAIRIIWMMMIDINKHAIPSQIRSIEMEQLDSILILLFEIVSITIPISIVTLAYRFDMSQANLLESDPEEIKSVLFTSEPDLDQYGCKRVKVSECFIDSSNSPTPIFNVTYYALILIQCLGIALEYFMKWTSITTFPTLLHHDTSQSNIVTYSWPMFAYLILPFVMLIKAKTISKETFLKLLKYQENWDRDDIKGDINEAMELNGIDAQSNNKSIA